MCPYKTNVATKAKTPIPSNMQDLPVDERGYVVPWFVDWLDGKPEFRAADGRKIVRCIKEKLCWVCGKKLGVNVCFVSGPMCGINRTSPEPPSHYDCGLWSAINCPFLNNPKTVRREDELINNGNFRENTPGIAIARNPGVALLWITRSYEYFRSGNGILFTMGKPERVEWYCEGRPATRQEVLDSVHSGLPNLKALAAQEGPSGLEYLNQCVERFMPYAPAEKPEAAT